MGQKLEVRACKRGKTLANTPDHQSGPLKGYMLEVRLKENRPVLTKTESHLHICFLSDWIKVIWLSSDCLPKSKANTLCRNIKSFRASNLLYLDIVRHEIIMIIFKNAKHTRQQYQTVKINRKNRYCS